MIRVSLVTGTDFSIETLLAPGYIYQRVLATKPLEDRNSEGCILCLLTLCWICSRSGCFGLKNRVIIKSLTHPCYSRNFDGFSWEFRLFLSLCRTALQTHRLSHISALHHLILLTQEPIPEIFEEKNWELVVFFLICDFGFFFQFFFFISMKISQHFLGSKDVSNFRWLLWFLAQNNICAKICNTVYMNKETFL